MNEVMILASVVDVVSEGLAVPLPRLEVMADSGSLAVERWSVLIQDRLSASTPIPRVPTHRKAALQLRTSCAQPLSCLLWESIGLRVGRFRGRGETPAGVDKRGEIAVQTDDDDDGEDDASLPVPLWITPCSVKRRRAIFLFFFFSFFA